MERKIFIHPVVGVVVVSEHILQISGEMFAIVGVVASAVVLWVILWVMNQYENRLAEGQ